MRTATMTMAMALLALLAGCTGPTGPDLEANKRLVESFNDAVNGADWAALEGIVTDDFKRHSAATPGPPVTSREDFVALQEKFLASFPDQHTSIRQIVAEGDRVAVLATYTGTQTGPLGDFPVTGKVVNVPFLAMFRIEGGKIAELWVEFDNVAILSQLSLFPPPGAGE